MCCHATDDDAARQRRLPVLHVDPAQLEAEVADLMSERERAVLEKNKVEEQYLQQIIAVSQSSPTFRPDHGFGWLLHSSAPCVSTAMWHGRLHFASLVIGASRHLQPDKTVTMAWLLLHLPPNDMNGLHSR